MSRDLVNGLKLVLRDVGVFAEQMSGVRLRRYQQEAAQAIVDSVVEGKGLSIVVVFPRQSGKNELQAQIEAYLLRLLSQEDAEIIKISPTWKPQSLNAMRRLRRVLERNLLTRPAWFKESGYIYRIDRARIFFLSGGPEANIVGATASTLLEVDEAQDVLIAKYDKDIAPMAASTNATRVFWGTVWTANTLLAREMRAAQAAEEADGKRRVFRVDADAVSAEVPAYGAFVAEQIARLGRQHPMVKTQFFCEEIDAEGGMFPAARRALMVGDHPRLSEPQPGRVYAFLLDVAGEDEGISGEAGDLSNSGRDSSALTVVEVDLISLADPFVKAPTYRVVDRRLWVGVKHTRLYHQLTALAERWRVRYLVVDATGIGAGLASFLDRALPGSVIPFTFNSASKSKLGWDFLGIIETGRFKDWWEDPGKGMGGERAEFWRQVDNCQMAVIPGPERRMRWGTPDGARDPETGELMHDDLVLSAALVAVLDGQEWSAAGRKGGFEKGCDPLRSIDREGY